MKTTMMNSMDGLSSAGASAKKKISSDLGVITSSSAKIWQSRLSWRIMLAVFMTILAIQVSVLSLTIKNEEKSQLATLRETARQVISPSVMGVKGDPLSPPLTQETANRIINTSIVDGVAVYSSRDFAVISLHGDPVGLRVASLADAMNEYYSGDGSFYEIVLRPSEINQGNGDNFQPYYVALKLDSTNIGHALRNYVWHSITVMFLLSAFVTTVLMVALGRWLLEPILFMRDNLHEASRNPESPQIKDSPFSEADEIGSAIKIAQNLIRQNAENIRQIKSAAQDQIHKLAYYDNLTGLPNRILFLQKLAEIIRAAGEAQSKRHAIVTLDLDHFKDINDTMGHSIGDTILRAVGKRLRAALPEQAIVARTGEDEFAITMPVSDTITPKDVAEKVHGLVKGEPFKVFNQTFQVRCSIGLATYPDNGTDPDHVLKNADIALNRAKEDGRDTIREYLADFDRAVQQRFQLLNDLREAIDNDELALYYQPQLDLKTGRVIGAEALLRWFRRDNSKEGGSFISPAVFVPVAEQSGLVVPMGEWVMKTACKTARSWLDQGIDIRVAVNVSGAQFQQSDLVAYTRKVLEETGLPARNLELEVTESAFMNDVQATIGTLNELHAMGVELAIDDFGTGYSSLSYLRQFPIDRLKIDQSFIKNALDNQDDASIARTIVALGHSLNLRVIAEGVETKEHESFLVRELCDEVQGYRYSRPVPNEKFIEFVTGYKGDLTTFGA